MNDGYPGHGLVLVLGVIEYVLAYKRICLYCEFSISGNRFGCWTFSFVD